MSTQDKVHNMRSVVGAVLLASCTWAAAMTVDDKTRDFDQLWNYSKPAETEARFRDLLQKSKDKDYRLELLTQIARCQGLQNRFKEAHLTLDDVEKELVDEPTLLKVRYLLERGRVFNSMGDPEQARPLFVQAFDIGRGIREDFFAVDAAHMVAIVEKGDKALEWNLRAVGLAEISDEERAKGWMASLYNNIGWTYHDMKEYELALDSFERALVARRKKGERSTTLIARWCVARCWRSLGRIDEALKEQRLLELEHRKDGNKDPYVQEELGELLLLKETPDEAAVHFSKAYDELSKDEWFVKNEAERLNRIKALAKR